MGSAAFLLTILFHVLTGVHAYALPPALAVIGLLALVAWTVSGRDRLLRWLQRDQLFVRRVAHRLKKSPYRFAVAAFFTLAAAPILRALILPPLGWDTLTYHAVKAAMWVQHRSVAGMVGPGPWAYYGQQLGGSEVFISWAMLPVRTDVFVPFIDIAEWIGLGLALMVLARVLRVREPYASIAVGFVLALPPVRLMIGSGYVELCSMATLIGGLALGLGTESRRPGRFVLAAGLLGISAATKVQMIPITAVVLVALTIRIFYAGGAKAAPWLVGAALAYVVAPGPWLLRTSAAMGTPLSPFPVQVGRLVLGQANPEVDWLLHRTRLEDADSHSEAEVLEKVFQFRGVKTEALGLFALVPILMTLGGVRPLARRAPGAVFTLLLTIACCLTMYFSNSFWILRHLWSTSSSRFLLPVVALATVASVAWCRRGSLAATGYYSVLVGLTLWNLLRYTLYGVSPTSVDALLILLGVLGAFAICAIAAGRVVPRMRWAALVTILVAALVALGAIRGAYRNDLFARDYVLHTFFSRDSGIRPFVRDWATVVPAVDELGVHRRIAVTSGPHQDLDNWFTYPFLGRNLQNDVVYVPISIDGSIRHFGRDGLNDRLGAAASFQAWRSRLAEQQITEVMSFAPSSIELSWMEQHSGEFKRVGGIDGVWGLFRVNVTRRE